MEEHFLFYIPSQYISGENVFFPDDEVHHLIRVLRKRDGDVVRVTDGAGRLLQVRLQVVGKKEVVGHVLEQTIIPPEPDRILAMGVIRQRDRLEFAIEKAVELGATRILLVHSDHAEKMRLRASRIDKTVISAMKQSKRCHLPSWEERHGFMELMSDYRESHKIIMAHPLGEENERWQPENTPMLLMSGPEGGFSGEEVSHAKSCGALVVSLGNARLRAETAACTLVGLAECRQTIAG